MIGRKRVLAALTSACLLAAATAVAGAPAKDPFVGTWKLNTARSKLQAGAPPKSSTVIVTRVGDKRRVAVHTVTAAGSDLNTESTAADDGKDYPMKGSPTVDTVAVTRIDARTIARTDKKAGRVVATLRATVSADGKTLTVNQNGATPQGQPYSNALVYDRQ